MRLLDTFALREPVVLQRWLLRLMLQSQEHHLVSISDSIYGVIIHGNWVIRISLTFLIRFIAWSSIVSMGISIYHSQAEIWVCLKAWYLKIQWFITIFQLNNTIFWYFLVYTIFRHNHLHVYMYTYIYMYTYANHIYTHIYIYMHKYITTHYITLHYVTLHYVTLRYITYIHINPWCHYGVNTGWTP